MRLALPAKFAIVATLSALSLVAVATLRQAPAFPQSDEGSPSAPMRVQLEEPAPRDDASSLPVPEKDVQEPRDVMDARPFPRRTRPLPKPEARTEGVLAGPGFIGGPMPEVLKPEHQRWVYDD